VSDNFKKNVKDAFIMPDVMGSDHCPVGIDIEHI
jgi:exodeoxyribonuclease-3